MCRITLFCVLFLLVGAPINAQFEVPDVLIEPLHPKGFSVSIPDEDGISLFAFHGKINEEIVNREAGTFSVDILKAKKGRWTFTDHSARLQPGDKIYYWVNVDYNNGNGVRGYIKDDQVYVVPDLVGIDLLPSGTTKKPKKNKGTVAPPPPPPPTRTTTTTTTTAAPTPCRPTSTMVNGKRTCQGKLIFQDSFATLSDEKWRPEIKFAGDPDYEFVIYQNNRENLYVDTNKLYIRPTLTETKYGAGFVSQPNALNLGDTCTGVPDTVDCVQKPKAWIILPPAISAQISTIDSFSFLYGIVEITARLPQGDWIYPELYLKSRSDSYGPGLDSGVITIGFTPGNIQLSNQLTGGCILGQSVTARNYAVKQIRSRKHWTGDFHVFRVEWRSDSITLMVDNQVYGNIYPPEEGSFASLESELELEPETAERWRKGGPFAPFDKEMYLALGVGVGGQCFANREDGTKPWDNDDPKAQLTFYRAQNNWSSTWGDNSTLIIDSVKIWAL